MFIIWFTHSNVLFPKTTLPLHPHLRTLITTIITFHHAHRPRQKKQLRTTPRLIPIILDPPSSLAHKIPKKHKTHQQKRLATTTTSQSLLLERSLDVLPIRVSDLRIDFYIKSQGHNSENSQNAITSRRSVAVFVQSNLLQIRLDPICS